MFLAEGINPFDEVEPGIHILNFHVSRWTFFLGGIWVALITLLVIGIINLNFYEKDVAKKLGIRLGSILGLIGIAVIAVMSGFMTWIGQQ